MKATAILALGTIPLASAWSVIYYSKPRCSGDIIAFENITHTQETCHQPLAMAGEPQSAQINWDDRDGEGFYLHDYYEDGYQKSVRFYDTDDCTSSCSHRHVIADSSWRDCLSWPLAAKDGRKMASFNMVRVGDIGMGREHGAISDGICRLEHGDRLFFRGMHWRMQQVGAAWFNEIPEEEWDPVKHAANTTVRFGQHGDVDVFGKYKLRDDGGYMDEIALEYWDEDKHYARKSGHWRDPHDPVHYQWMLDDLCEDATREDVDRELLLAKIPAIDEVCKGWKDGFNVEDYKDQIEYAYHADLKPRRRR